eukprot:15179117-Alexandrium_andersonii.AAC.1
MDDQSTCAKQHRMRVARHARSHMRISTQTTNHTMRKLSNTMACLKHATMVTRQMDANSDCTIARPTLHSDKAPSPGKGPTGLCDRRPRRCT